MSPLTIIVWGALLPALVVAAALLLSRRAHRARTGDWLAGVGVAAAYVVGAWGLGRGAFADDPNSRLLWIAVAGALVGVIEARVATGRRLRWLLRAAASVAAAWWLVAPLVAPQQMSVATTGAYLALLAGSIVVAWTTIAGVAVDEDGPALSVALALLAAGVSAVALLSGLVSTAQVAGVLVATLGAVFLLALRYPMPGWLGSAAPVLAMLLVGHLATGWLYGEMPTASLLLLLAAPLTLLVARLAVVRRTTRLFAVIARLLVVAVPVGAAATTAAIVYLGADVASSAPSSEPASATDSDTSYDEDYGY